MRSDIERYKQQVARLGLTGVDFAAFRDDPLAPEALRCLRYMHDVEHHTVCYLRDLLVTPVHRDPAITTFLTLWAYEEMWHGEAIDQLFGDADGRRMAQRIDGCIGRLPACPASASSRTPSTATPPRPQPTPWTARALPSAAARPRSGLSRRCVVPTPREAVPKRSHPVRASAPNDRAEA